MPASGGRDRKATFPVAQRIHESPARMAAYQTVRRVMDEQLNDLMPSQAADLITRLAPLVAIVNPKAAELIRQLATDVVLNPHPSDGREVLDDIVLEPQLKPKNGEVARRLLEHLTAAANQTAEGDPRGPDLVRCGWAWRWQTEQLPAEDDELSHLLKELRRPHITQKKALKLSRPLLARMGVAFNSADAMYEAVRAARAKTREPRWETVNDLGSQNVIARTLGGSVSERRQNAGHDRHATSNAEQAARCAQSAGEGPRAAAGGGDPRPGPEHRRQIRGR